MAYTFYDLCCGTGALTLRLLDAPRSSPFPMTGCKRAYADPILVALGAAGRRPANIVMADCGPWGNFWTVLAQERLGVQIAEYIEDVIGPVGEGAELFDHLKTEPVPADALGQAAVLACLQVANGRGRAVQINDGVWRTHGYGHLSNLAREKGFPERLRPHRVAERVRGLAAVDWPTVAVHTGDLRTLNLAPQEGDVVVLDPPYKDTLGYGGLDLDRPEVLYQGHMLAVRGATVGICERESLANDLPGWVSHEVKGKMWQKRSMGKGGEWITISPPLDHFIVA